MNPAYEGELRAEAEAQPTTRHVAVSEFVTTPLDSIGGTGVGPSREPRMREEDGKASGTSGATQSSRTAADPGNAASVLSSQDRSTPPESVVEEAQRYVKAYVRGEATVGAKDGGARVPIVGIDLVDRLADRVEELETAVARAAESLRHPSPLHEYERGIHKTFCLGCAVLRDLNRVIARQARRQSLSTQPHQDR